MGGINVPRFKDRYVKPLAGGYGDLQLAVEVDGVVGELQLNFDIMLLLLPSSSSPPPHVLKTNVGPVRIRWVHLAAGCPRLAFASSKLGDRGDLPVLSILLPFFLSSPFRLSLPLSLLAVLLVSLLLRPLLSFFRLLFVLRARPGM